MAESKHRRDAIGAATCHRLLHSGAFEGARVSALAAKEARKQLKSLLKEVGARAEAELALTKKKTVTEETVARALLGHCNGVKKADLKSSGHSDKVRGLPKAGVVRVVKKSLPDVNISEKGKEALVGGAEAYLRALGDRAGMLARAGKRSTLSSKDVEAAAKILSQ